MTKRRTDYTAIKVRGVCEAGRATVILDVFAERARIRPEEARALAAALAEAAHQADQAAS